jgi:hypothetical protein
MKAFSFRTLSVAGMLLGAGTAGVLHSPGHAVASPDVTIVSTPANPAIVRDVDSPARLFFQTSTGTLSNAFNPSGFGLTLTSVPAGKVLVIEFVSAFCQGTPRVVPNAFRLSAGVAHFFSLAVTEQQGIVTQSTRIYAGPNTDVNLSVFPTTNGTTITCDASISGYFVNQ